MKGTSCVAKHLPNRTWQSLTVTSLLVAMGTSAGCAASPLLAITGPARSAMTAVPAAPTGAHLIVPHRYQGQTMACGPSSLWSVMTYTLGAGKVNFDNLDKSLRPTGDLTDYIGTMPGALALAPERYHLTATVRNNATTRDLRHMLDNGLPIVILGSRTGGKTSSLHYVVVNGYEGAGEDTTWIITDSMVVADVESRWSNKDLLTFWSNCKIAGRSLPYDKATVNVATSAKADLLPEDNRTTWLRFLDVTLKRTFDVLRWLDNRDQLGGATDTASPES